MSQVIHERRIYYVEAAQIRVAVSNAEDFKQGAISDKTAA
jgi:hypothetical protein